MGKNAWRKTVAQQVSRHVSFRQIIAIAGVATFLFVGGVLWRGVGLAHPYDLFAHAIGYGTLFLVLAGSVGARAASVVAMVAGLLIEGLQGFVPHRDPDLMDIVANAIGTASAAGLYGHLTHARLGLKRDP